MENFNEDLENIKQRLENVKSKLDKMKATQQKASKKYYELHKEELKEKQKNIGKILLNSLILLVMNQH